MAGAGGRLVCLHVPRGTSVGLDAGSWTVGPEFRGFAGIPTGPHLLHYASKPDAPRCAAFFHVTGSDDVLVARWDAAEEVLTMCVGGGVEDGDDAARAAATAAAAGAFDRQLGPYPMERAPSWRLLSAFITPAVVQRFQPVGGTVKNRTAGGDGGGAGHPATGSSVSDAGAANTLFFLPVLGTGAAATARGIAACALDTSPALVHAAAVLERKHGVHDPPTLAVHIVGELQASFLLAWLGESLAALEQWKRLVDAVLRAEDAMAAAMTTTSTHGATPAGIDTVPVAVVTRGAGGAGKEETGTVAPSPPHCRFNAAFFVAALGVVREQLRHVPEEWHTLLEWSQEGSRGAPPAAAAVGREEGDGAGFMGMLDSVGSGLGPTFLHRTLASARLILQRAEAGIVSLPHPVAEALRGVVAGSGGGVPTLPSSSTSTKAHGVPSTPSLTGLGVPSWPCGDTAAMEALLHRLRLEGGDDDLPEIVMEEGSDSAVPMDQGDG